MAAVDEPLYLDHGDPVAVELTAAVHLGDLATLRRLLADSPALASARIVAREGRTGGWRTPLHLATDWPGFFPSAPAAVTLLIAAGADPDTDTGGNPAETPLHWAASSDDVDVAAALLDGGAGVAIPRGSIGTPLDNAIGYGCWRVARLLVARGAPVEKLWHAAALGLVERTRALLSADRPAEDGISQAFWQACHGGQRRTAELLLDAGADINAVPGYAKRTALEAATAPGTSRDLLRAWLEGRGARPAGRAGVQAGR